MGSNLLLYDPLVYLDETVEPTFEDGSKEKTIPGQGNPTRLHQMAVTFTQTSSFRETRDPITETWIRMFPVTA